MAGCRFTTVSGHSTSSGRLVYQRCVCGAFRVLLDAVEFKRLQVPPTATPNDEQLLSTLNRSGFGGASALPPEPQERKVLSRVTHGRVSRSMTASLLGGLIQAVADSRGGTRGLRNRSGCAVYRDAAVLD